MSYQQPPGYGSPPGPPHPVDTSNRGRSIAIIVAVGILAAGASAMLSLIQSSPTAPTGPASAESAPAAMVPIPPPRGPSAEFGDYMRALAPLMPAIFGAQESPDICAQIPDTARESAPEALECIRQRAHDARASAVGLRAIQPPTEFRGRHAELITFADEGVVALNSYFAAFAAAVPRLERLRRRRPLSSLWVNLAEQRHPPEILESLDASARVFEASFTHRLDWLGQMHPQCNQRLRCVLANADDAALANPQYRDARGRSALQANCECIRVWATLRGETTWRLLAAGATDLPPWSNNP